MTDKMVLSSTLKEATEKEIIVLLADTKKISVADALDVYYRSNLAQQISDGEYGLQYLEPSVLLEDLIENEPELFV